jgi:VCBS repeat-containing protein
MATITVTTLNDVVASDGLVSLREAIAAANTDSAGNDAAAGSGADTIVFDPSLIGTVRLTLGQLTLSTDLTIDGDRDGDGISDITISGDANDSGVADLGDSRVLYGVTATADIALKNLTITDGYGDGGAIVTFGANLLILNSSVTDSKSVTGGAGGGIFTTGNLTVIGSTISGNTTTGTGGGLMATGTGLLTIVNSTIADNHADLYGGGFLTDGTRTTVVVNSTISGNSSGINGGGISIWNGGSLELLSSTVTKNSSSGAGKGVELYDGAIFAATNSVIAGNGSNDVADYMSISVVPNTITANNSFFGAGALDIDFGANNTVNGGDPGLAPLANNGGRVQTHATLPSSPLIGQDIGAIPDHSDLIVTSSSDDGDDATFGTNLAEDYTDGGGLSLREAINWAASGETIGFSAALAGQTILLQDELELVQDVAIVGDTNGDGKADITISGNSDNSGAGDVRIFNISGQYVTLSSLTLTHGNAGSGYGGAIYVGSTSMLLLSQSTISDSSAKNGGGIFAYGNLYISDSTVHHNHAIVTAGYGGFGGGIYVGGNGLIVNTTISHNSAGDDGGGIDTSSDAGLRLYTSTVTMNSAGDQGGGLDLFDGAFALVGSSIVSGNTAAGSQANIARTGDSLANGYLAIGYSLLGSDVTGPLLNYAILNKSSDTPMLGALGDNGGAVWTMAPLDGSLAVNNGIQPPDFFDQDGDGIAAGPFGELMPFDARGGLRLVGGAPDIGAVEKQASDVAGALTENASTTTASGNVLNNDGVRTVTGLRIGSEAGGGTINAVGTIAGTYGSLTLAANGNWTYALNNADTDTNALKVGAVVTDKFTYRVQSGGLTDTAELVITITGANDAPIITSNGAGATASINIAENSTTVTSISGGDVDTDSVLTYSLVGGADQGKFQINATTGALAFIAASDREAPTDAGSNNVYDVIVRATDNNGGFDDQTIAITVTDVDGHTILGHKTKGDTINSSKPAGNAVTGEEDIINGRGGNDTVNAGGGNDTVKGGLGVDVLDGSSGRDTVDFSDMTKAVVLTLKGSKSATATVGGVADDKVKKFEDIKGGKAGDKLTGDAKANQLDGGLGADSLTGGGAEDWFQFSSKLGSGNVDTLTDFNAVQDKIALDDAIFAAIGPTLDADEFYAKAGATKAKDAEDRIIYNKTTGNLYFDADGTGTAKSAILFATLSNKPSGVDGGDFLIV